MNLIPSLNPATINLNRIKADLILNAINIKSDKKETLIRPLKVYYVNNRVYREVRLHKKRQKKRTAQFQQYDILIEEEYKSKVNDEKKWVYQLYRGLIAYEARSFTYINSYLIREYKKAESTAIIL